jgi:LmbE family N-acetylglucosaminyl deacetylase
VLRDAAVDPTGDPVLERLVPWLRRVRGSGDLVLVPAGLGDHLDHRLVAAAGIRLAAEHDDHLGFYEDRPYVSFLDDEVRDAQLDRLGLDLEPVEVSGPVTEGLHRRLRRCYPSQISEEFVRAMAIDRTSGARERVWLPAGRVPTWLQP